MKVKGGGMGGGARRSGWSHFKLKGTKCDPQEGVAETVMGVMGSL